MNTETIVLIVIAAGLLISLIVLISRLASVKAQLGVANNRLVEEKAQADATLKQRLSEKQQEMESLRREDDRRHEEAMKAQEIRFNQTIDNMKAQVKAATEDLLQERQEEFSKTSTKSLTDIVNPLKEAMGKMQEVMDKNKQSQTELRTQIKDQMESMVRQSEAVQKSTEELSRAFKHQTKLQGDWGESILAEQLKAQGFVEGVHYHTQYTLQDEQGNVIKSDDDHNLRPDVVLQIEPGKDVIIDAKVSVSDFIKYANANNDEEATTHLANHVKSLEKHVDELARKDYSKYHYKDDSVVDFVIMFVPMTQALWSAMRAKPTLWRDAADKRVLIADEQTLYAMLKIINKTWIKIEQEKNQQQIYNLAQLMVDRVGEFLKSYEEIGNQLEAATESFNKGRLKLQDTGRSIVGPARNLIDLGLKGRKPNKKGKMVSIIPEVYLGQESIEDAEAIDITEETDENE